jgi:allophanate hydrolase subunit 1
MTKVEKRFRLLKPPDEAALARLAQAHALYGIQKLVLAPSLDTLTVEYDATRLRPAEVDSALAVAGVDAEPE